MSLYPVNLFDTDALAESMPFLICETDIEKQAANLKRWLDSSFPVKSMGISITDSEKGKCIFGIDMKEQIIEEIEKRLYENNIDNDVQSQEKQFFFTISNSGVIDEASEFNGVAIGLNYQNNAFGTFFLVSEDGHLSTFFADTNRSRWFSTFLSSILHNTWSHHQYQEKIRFYNLYETVSSSLCYAEDLQELLTTIISIIVSEVSSEEGSILLYNDETNELEFYSAIGDTGSGYIQCSFPADQGIAGKALQDGLPLIVNDVPNCPYFFGKFDDESGFVTKSILAAPIILGGRKVGVIEAINKIGNSGFDENDKKILIAIADEIGLAVKNARMFEYVVNSYCKIRQGEMSCKGCVRPLKSWTPSARQLDLT